MLARTLVMAWLALAAQLTVAAPTQASAPAQLPAPAQWLPANDIVALLEVRRPVDLLNCAREIGLFDAISANPAYQKAAAQPQFKGLINLVDGVATRLATDRIGLVSKLAGGGITWAFYTPADQVLILDSQDPAALRTAQWLIVAMIRSQGGAPPDGQQPPPQQEQQGVTIWNTPKAGSQAMIGNRLIWATNPQRLTAILELRETGQSLADQPRYQEAAKAAGDGAIRFLVNFEKLKAAPQVQQALRARGNPMDMFLTAAMRQALLESTWLGAGLSADGGKISLRAAVDGKCDPATPAAFMLPAAGGAMPNITVPRQLAAISLWRDLARFYSAKDTLFPERTSELILFENFIEIFFSGRDLTGEIFAEPKPPMRLVVARPVFDAKLGTPQPQTPNFALVLQLKHPEQFAEVMEEAWQKAIGIVNFTRGQKAQSGLIIDKLEYNGVRFSCAYYSQIGEKDKAHLPIRFNARPSLAIVGQHMILASSDSITRDLIDALKKETSQPLADGTHSVLEIGSGTEIAEILAVNRAELVRQTVVSGVSMQEAEGRMALIEGLVKRLKGVRLAIGASESGHLATLDIEINRTGARP